MFIHNMFFEVREMQTKYNGSNFLAVPEQLEMRIMLLFNSVYVGLQYQLYYELKNWGPL